MCAVCVVPTGTCNVPGLIEIGGGVGVGVGGGVSDGDPAGDGVTPLGKGDGAPLAPGLGMGVAMPGGGVSVGGGADGVSVTGSANGVEDA